MVGPKKNHCGLSLGGGGGGGGRGGVRIIAPKRRETQHGTTILIASNAVSGLLVLKFWLLRCPVFLALLMDVLAIGSPSGG